MTVIDSLLKLTDFFSKVLLGIASAIVAYHFASREDDRENQRERLVLIEMFQENMQEVENGQASQTTVEVAFDIAKLLKERHGSDVFIRVYESTVSTRKEADGDPLGADIERLKASEAAQVRQLTNNAEGATEESIYHAVVGSFTDEGAAKAYAASLLVQLQIFDEIELTPSVYLSANGYYAVVLQRQVGCLLSQTEVRELVRFARDEGLRSDAYGQLDADWQPVPDLASGLQC